MMFINCFAAFVAENLTVDVTLPTQQGSVTVKSVFGWVMIHQHLGNSFNWRLSWADYKNGFGSIEDNFWLGLDKMHLFTSSQPYRLRVELQQETTGLWYSAEFSTFTVGDEASTYRLNVDGCNGDAGSGMLIQVNSGWGFTTWDRDNDGNPNSNCASDYDGGWWHINGYYTLITSSSIHYWNTLPGDNFVINSRMMMKQQEPV